MFVILYMKFLKLKNPIQTYAWGSRTAINELFDIENLAHESQAEIWMGVHKNGCSQVTIDNELMLLSDWIEMDKRAILSGSTVSQFDGLPYLFKVLAADSALSIQVHPNKEEAEAGFLRENLLGIELTAPNRNYRDANHKPELIYALTSYQVMNGFRGLNDIIFLFSSFVEFSHTPSIALLVDKFKSNLNSEGLKNFFTEILSLSGNEKKQSIDSLLSYADEYKKPCIDNDIYSLILELARCYPNDIGLFSPMILNVITLRPNEAMFIDARTPHAYIKGTGLEIMANSDNVLRAGLTSKHIDVDELVRCTSFEEKSKSSLLCQPRMEGNRRCYSTPVTDFRFDVFMQAEEETINVNSAEIVFAIDDDAFFSHISGECLIIHKGESVFIPAYTENYTLSSKGRVARAYN